MPLAETYRNEGLNMLYQKFSNPPGPGEEEGKGGNSVEYGVIEMLDRMKTKRFKAARHLKAFFDEKGTYHRKDGRIVPLMDDVISATRYATLSIRHARTPHRNVTRKNRSLGARNFAKRYG